MSLSTIGVILAAAVVLVIALRILSGLLRLGIAIAILGLVGYWLFAHLPANITDTINTFPK